MNDGYLLLWLEAPLQAWGHDSKFGRRDSLEFPTKSGIFGLLCCALGAGGEQTERLAQWSNCDVQLRAYGRKDKQTGVVQRQPLLRDFHMVGSGYDDKDPWQTLLVPKTNLGKKAVGGGAKLTHRFYVQDMAYAVLLQGPTPELEQLQSALQNPVWDVFLGRKNCVPTEFIAQGVLKDHEEAVAAGERLADAKNRGLMFTVLEGEHDGEVFVLNDVPVQFGERKRYRDRRVTRIPEL